jgi:hypothetical protein
MSQIGTLSFDLTDPDDRAAFATACNAPAMMAAMFEFQQYLREQVKYHEEGDRDDMHGVRDKWYEIMTSHGITVE